MWYGYPPYTSFNSFYPMQSYPYQNPYYSAGYAQPSYQVVPCPTYGYSQPFYQQPYVRFYRW